MKFISIVSCLIFLVGCTANQIQKQQATLVGINIEKNKCVLIEGGSGYKENYVEFKGKLRREYNQVYSCAVEIPDEKFKEKLGSTCFLRGFNRTTSHFYKGVPEAIRKQSCRFYQLRSGAFYFHASGIQLDSCDWTCI